MPNWCEYQIDFFGDEQDLARLADTLTAKGDQVRDDYWDGSSGKYDLALAYPCPTELMLLPAPPKDEAIAQEMTEKYGAPDWYYWCIKNWGTKWSPAIFSFLNDDGILSIGGQSAWGPPDELVRKITELFPVKAMLVYSESGMCFAGADGFLAGEKVYGGYFDWDTVPGVKSLSEKMENLSWEDDAWQETYEEQQDLIHNFRYSHEMECYKSLGLAS
jgi:hypothetical protein